MKAIAASFSQISRLPSAFSAATMSWEENSPRLVEMPPCHFRLGQDRFEDEIRGVDLTVRMRIGDAHHLAFVFEDEHVRHFRSRGQLRVLGLPCFEQAENSVNFQLRQRHVVSRIVTDHSRQAVGAAVLEDRLRANRRFRRVRPHAG